MLAYKSMIWVISKSLTLIVFSLLMFIGCSPSSVGGGIRTTTVAIIGLYLYSFLKSEDNINIFGRRIDNDDVRKSVVVFMLSLGMCFFCIVFLSATENQQIGSHKDWLLPLPFEHLGHWRCSE